MRRSAVLLATAAMLLVASPAAADPALPSNYVSSVEDVDTAAVSIEVQGGDAFLVVEVAPGTELMVPGYDSDEDFSDWQELEQYLRVLPDGTVQLNRNSEAYYNNAARFGALPEGEVGPDVEPDWETVATDGRAAWHDHRIHFMSPELPRQVDTSTSDPQRVFEYRIPLIIDGELVVAEGTLDFVADRAPVGVIVLALLGIGGGFLAARADRRLSAVLLLVAGGLLVGLTLATTTGRAAGFDISTPPLVLAAVGAVAPLLGATVSSMKESQRKGLALLGAGAMVLYGVMAFGVLDGVVGGDGFGNWWLRPTLPIDVAPGLYRLSLAAATGLGLGSLAAAAAEPIDLEDELPAPSGAADDAGDERS